MRISDWSADVCSSDLLQRLERLDTIGAPDFDAVLLPDTGQTLRVAAASLAYYDANQPAVRLLGLRNWDEVRTLGSEPALVDARSEEHTSELQSLMRTSYAVFC